MAAISALDCNESAGTVRKIVPSSLTVRSLSLDAVGQSVIFRCLVRPFRIEIDSGVEDGPRIQDAPLSTTARAAERAACGSPCGSAVASFTVILIPAADAALL